MKKVIIIAVFLSLVSQTLTAQQEAQYTQYMYNTLSINPAYAGSRGDLSIGLLHRSQWLGLDGAPRTQTLNISAPVSEKSGLGLSIVNDQIGNGTIQSTRFDLAYSYTVQTSEVGKLSFGLKAGGELLNVDFNKLRNYRPELTPQSDDVDRKFSPNFGAGIYYHTDKFYAGLSVPNFLQTSHYDDASSTSSFFDEERLNWYLISGYVFDLNPNLKLKPATLIKAVSGAPLQIDLSANFLINGKFTLGAAYRWDAAFSGLFGFQITDSMLLGIAYDKEITELGSTQFNDGSFELFFRYDFKTRSKKALTPRFF